MPDVGFRITDIWYDIQKSENCWCFIILVQRMLDDLIVAPDAESRRDEEIRGKEVNLKFVVPSGRPI
jgi:hypothetical protein